MPVGAPRAKVGKPGGRDTIGNGATGELSTPPAANFRRETSMRHAVLILSLALAAGPGFAADPPADEPVHGGKKLSEWVKQLEDKDPTARADAGRAIGIMGPQAKAAVPALIKALKDPEPSVRDWACYGLSNIGPHAKDAVPALEDLLLHDKTMKVRRIAANALGSIGPAAKPAVPSLIKTLQDDDPWMRHFGAVTLGALGESAKDAVPELIKAFGDEEYVVQKSAVEAVGQIGPKAKEAVPALLKVWRDPGEYEKTRKAAAKSIRQIDPETAKKEGVP